MEHHSSSSVLVAKTKLSNSVWITTPCLPNFGIKVADYYRVVYILHISRFSYVLVELFNFLIIRLTCSSICLNHLEIFFAELHHHICEPCEYVLHLCYQVFDFLLMRIATPHLRRSVSYSFSYSICPDFHFSFVNLVSLMSRISHLICFSSCSSLSWCSSSFIVIIL